MSLYDTLNVAADADPETIRNGYLSMSRLHHPDKSAGSDGAAFRDVNRAYKVLSDPTLREFYDKHGLGPTELLDADTLASAQLVRSEKSRVGILEHRVRTLMRTSDELHAQRFLQPTVSMTMGSRILQYSPLYHTWSYTATQAGVSMLTGKHSLALFASAHTQRGGAAVSRASLILGSAFSPSITTRAVVHVMGGRWPGFEVMVQKSVSDETVLRQTFSVDKAITVSTEWIQQLGAVVIGTLGVTLGQTRGISMELVKKAGGPFSRFRAKVRLGLVSDGLLSLSSKVKFVPVNGIELHVGPSINSTGNLSFDLAFQTELPPLVEEQEGAFPTLLQWSLGLEYPQNLTVGIKLSRGGFNFNFPIDLPEVETKWALIAALALWTFAPFATRGLLSQVTVSKTAAEPNPNPTHTSEGAQERARLVPEATERRRVEEGIEGLVIIDAKYADLLDVTDVLMARVRNSSLALSSTTKSTLVGFRYPTAGHDLRIIYTYGDKQYERIFHDNEVVILP